MGGLGPTDIVTVFDLGEERGRSYVVAELMYGGYLDSAIEDDGAKVTHNPLPELTGDETQLAWVFQNLFSNEIKFQCEAPPHVHVSTKHVEESRVCSVRNNDIGIGARPYA